MPSIYTNEIVISSEFRFHLPAMDASERIVPETSQQDAFIYPSTATLIRELEVIITERSFIFG